MAHSARLAPLLLSLLSLLARSSADGSGETCVLIHFLDRDIAAIERAAHEASSHTGPRAGAFLRPEEIAELTGRTQAELDAAAAFVGGLGGRMQEVGPMRDLAAACFPPPALAALLAAPRPAQRSTAQQDVAAGTLAAVKARPDASSGTAAAAHALAAALPADLAAITAFVEPLVGGGPAASSSSMPASQRRLLSSGGAPSRTAAGISGPVIVPRGVPPRPVMPGAAAAAAAGTAMPAWKPVAGSLGASLPSGFVGRPLPYDLGTWNGWQDPAAKTAWGMPQFASPDALMYFLGISDIPTILNNINTQPLATALMSPCGLTLGPGNTVTGVTYATSKNALECMPQFFVTYTPIYAGTPTSLGPNVTVPISPKAVSITTCGQAVAKANGQLPRNTCWGISQQMARATNISAAAAPIGNDTAIYVLDLAQALPTYSGLYKVIVEALLPPSLPAMYHYFGIVMSASFTGPVTIAGRNRPEDLLKLHNVPPPAAPGAKGLMAGVSLFVPSNYNYSPKDLQLANQALGAPVPNVTDVVSAPWFPPNSPRDCYVGYDCGEPALDIQMISQYSQGTGSSYGFAASSNNSAFNSITNPQLFRALLSLKPLPDVMGWSWGNANVDGVGQLRASESLLAKLAALGITVSVSTGDWGAFYLTDSINMTNYCDFPIGPSYPAASQWVTAIGGVMMSRVAPGQPPRMVACMSSAGGVITTGGGFGNVSVGSTPAWQQKQVAKYVASQRMRPDWPLSPANARRSGGGGSAYCSSPTRCNYGRGYPDVSVIGAAVPVVSAGAPERMFGTSIGAPLFAGLVQHLNAAVRATRGLEKCRMGYLNPFLYWAAEKYPRSYTDVYFGSNDFTMLPSPPESCGYGYHASKGWDAVTGLGVPNIGVLQQAAIAYKRAQLKSSGRCG